MADCARDDEFDYDKPGAERSRRRRGGEEDDLDSDLEEDLLEEDWLSSKKNPSELSDEDLNDDLLQSDEEEQDTSAQGAVVSLNATTSFNESYGYPQGEEYAAEDYGAVEGEEYGDEYAAGQNEDEVLELQIDEPLGDEFQVDDFSNDQQADQQEVMMDERAEPGEEVDQDVHNTSQLLESEEPEPEAEAELDVKEESDEEEDDGKESGRQRFMTERKDSNVIRLSDAASKRRNIPQTLELTDEAKAELLEFEDKERQRRQGRFCGRDRGGGRGWGGGPGGGMGHFRRDRGIGRGRMNESRPPLLQMNMSMQARMFSPHSPHRPQSHHSIQRGGGTGLFPTPMVPIPQQPLQPLIPPRSPVQHSRPHQDLRPPRPHGPSHALSHQQQPKPQQQPKNIHINPHFRGSASSSPVQVPLLSPAPSQPRPNLNPQRFQGPVDFQQQQQLQGNFLHPQRPPPQDQWRGPPPPHPDREPFFNEPRFPNQGLFDMAAPLLGGNLLPLSFPQPLPGPGPRPGFCPPGPGMFPRELPPRHGLPPQPSPAPPTPRNFMGLRQSFSPQQHGAPFSPQHGHFGLQNLMQPHPQPGHQDGPPPHLSLQEQPLPLMQHQHQHQRPPPPDQRPLMQQSHPPFHHPNQGGARPMKPRLQNNRMRMGSPGPSPQHQGPLQRNSNLRELPVAPGNNPFRPTQPRAVSRGAPDHNKPGPGPRAGPIGRGQGINKALPTEASETKKVIPTVQQSTPGQNKTPVLQTTPTQYEDEDEETRQYRLKIEEQKRLREEILKRKEMRRQMQAGARKKELLERIGAKTQPQTAQSQPLVPPPQPQVEQTWTSPSPLLPQTPSVPAVAPNGIKSRLQNTKVQPQAGSQQIQPIQRLQTQRQVPQPQNPNLIVAAPAKEENIEPLQNPPHALRTGGKRTVMQRVNTGGVVSPQIPQKVRVVKRLVGGEVNLNPDSQPQQQPIGRLAPQQRLGPPRKVTVGTAGPQQQGQQPELNQPSRVVVSGRGRGRGGRVMSQSRQITRIPDSKPTTVSIDGLSSSTTEKQIINLLNSIGPIQTFQMMPEQRKAVATFANHQHALSFQHSFHKHMIDLSHIDVTILDG